MRRVVWMAAAGAAIGAWTPVAAEEPPLELLVCAPGFPGTPKQAQSVMDALGKAIATGAGWAATHVKARYVATEKDGLAALKAKRPALLLTTIPFYSKHHARIGGELVAASQLGRRASQGFRVLAPAGASAGDASWLRGKRLAGTRVGDATFLTRVVFRGAVDAAKDLTLIADKRTLRAVKNIGRGKADAVLLSDEEWRLLQTPRLKTRIAGWVEVFRSAPLPTAPVVALGTDPKARPDPALVRSVRTALLALHKSDAGRKLCERLRVTGFGKPDPKTYAAVVKLYHPPRKKPAAGAKDG